MSHSPLILDGNKLAAEIRSELREKVSQTGKSPCLAAILVGNDGGSESYVAHKMNDCAEVGFQSRLIRFPDSVSSQELLQAISNLNSDPGVDGFIVQLPLPPSISNQTVIQAIAPEKDVDGFHPENIGKLSLGLPCFVAATPWGIMELLRRYQIPLSGKHAVVVGRSNIVGSPLSVLMSRPGADSTVTLTHSKTKNLKEICQQADIVVAALGKPGFLTADMVAEGAVVIDVGTTRVPDSSHPRGWRLKGDVDFESVAPKCAAITPVPGGVGPMTRVGLLMNTWRAFETKLNP
ncbi:MAG: bifunctional 5,10-methylenetetrahydrofolate dehydrogenase/5,10-methenyltetrahydrofolate cyclohydrolase [Bacteroidetes bacterium]|nr:bifunctional 5,10-methylenetetrahydrofolate dehydrogenase/5,10-methenyltetrahydrofolate cyclohydrolase [Bacteroidota bacterium]